MVTLGAAPLLAAGCGQSAKRADTGIPTAS